MIEPDLVGGLGRVCCGTAIPGPGSLIAFRGRVEPPRELRRVGRSGQRLPVAGGTALFVAALVVARESIE